MTKPATTLLIIYCLVVTCLTNTVRGQVANAVQPDDNVVAESNSKKVVDLKKVFATETKNLRAAKFDPVKIDRENARKQTAKKGWTTGQKLLLIGFIVGVAAIVYIVAKYGKDCLRSDPPDCIPGVDENCVCEEYERRIPQ